MLNEALSLPKQTSAHVVRASGTFSPVVPLPMRWARARTWARRARVRLPDPQLLTMMRHHERANCG